MQLHFVFHIREYQPKSTRSQMKHARFFLLYTSMIVMGYCNFLNGKSLTDVALTPNEISEDSLLQMSKESYMLPYIKYLMTSDFHLEDGETWLYTLVFIDNDDIPEMIFRGTSYADGILVMSQNNGIVSSIDGLKEVNYFERTGLLKVSGCYMGHCYYKVFQLKNGKFELTATMRSEESLKFANPVSFYYFNDAKVDEDTAEKLLEKAFGGENAASYYELEWIEWADLLKNKENIKGWK